MTGVPAFATGTATEVLIVAETRLHRDGLAEILVTRPISVCGTAGDVDEALEQAQTLSPDVIVVDVPIADTVATVQQLVAEVPSSRVLVLVGEVEAEVIAGVEAGAAVCVTRDASIDELISAIEGVIRGEPPCEPWMTAALFKRLRSLAAGKLAAGLEEPLTPREREIVALIDEGLSNKQISQRLCIEPATVKNHVHNILEKLHVARRGEAAAAVRHRAEA